MTPTRSDQKTPSLLDQPEMRTVRVARVALLRPIDKPYSFRVPEPWGDRLKPGMRVAVPFGRRDSVTTGFCISVSEAAWDATLKPVLEMVDAEPLLNAKMLELGFWVSRYYGAHLGRTLDLMVPAAAKRREGRKTVRYAVRVTDAAADGKALSKKQAAVLAALEAAVGGLPVADCAKRAGCTAAVIGTLAKRGRLTIEARPAPWTRAEPGVAPHEPPYELNKDQQAAESRISAAVEQRTFSVQVLFGVTGSGKTEVYIRAIRRALDAGRQAIMLIPEIALTTQTVRRLEQRFERVATIHSGLSGGRRARTWEAIARGEAPVVIGTRSAVFAPCPDLGVIIVDEEAEPSFKSQAAPRYHTRDVAIKRAHLEGIPVVLGSATPSLETWSNLKRRSHFHLIRMPHRVRGLPMPTVHLVDMRVEHRARRGVHLLSRAMELHLRDTLERKEQAVLLLNRRGYAGYLHCARCETVVTCPHCSVRMVLHQSTKLAHCHYCRARLAVPNRCPTLGCGGNLVRFGMGTERVEEELKRKFPEARVRRIDSDIMRRASDYADLLGAFERRAFDILVGTQMVAKGLDFPFVSFVGVVSADTALALDDFRSEERTFQLVLQVSGRSGRGDAPGHVVVQTFSADTAPIRHAVRGDYEAFARLELDRRREAHLPPFTRMVRIVLADGRLSRVKAAAESMAENLTELLAKRGIAARVLEAQPSAIARIRNRYRYDVILIFETAAGLMSAMDLFKAEGSLRARVKNVTVDVDPVSLQ